MEQGTDVKGHIFAQVHCFLEYTIMERMCLIPKLQHIAQDASLLLNSPG
jgi:hypothetical protein